MEWACLRNVGNGLALGHETKRRYTVKQFLKGVEALNTRMNRMGASAGAMLLDMSEIVPGTPDDALDGFTGDTTDGF